jgi:hypothetical protein
LRIGGARQDTNRLPAQNELAYLYIDFTESAQDEVVPPARVDNDGIDLALYLAGELGPSRRREQ